MQKIKDKVKAWLFEEESGQGLVEYALIIVLVAAACVISIMFMKVKVITSLTKITQDLDGGTP